MNTTVIIIEIICTLFLFTALTLGMLLINPLTFISDYPPEIQEEYYKSQHKEATKAKLTVIMKLKKAAAVILFIFILAWMLHIAGCRTFLSGLIYAYSLILAIFAWDTFVLDWCLFPNIKRARLPGTEHMDKEYHQKWFHVKVCLPAIPLFAIMGALCSLLMLWIW